MLSWPNPENPVFTLDVEIDDLTVEKRVDSGRGQDSTLRGKAPVECAIDGWS